MPSRLHRKIRPLSYTLLVFCHLLAASIALGAIVATDLRLLSKLAQDKVRIAPPNEFVARIVMLSLCALWITGGLIVWHGLGQRADYLANPKLQLKIYLVAALTVNAFVLHRVTFPRLARGRRVPRWTLSDWLVIAVPVAVSNFLWLFAAFLGIARTWNYVVPLGEILATAAGLFVVAQCGVITILAVAGRRVEPDATSWIDRLARSLARIGRLGTSEAADSRPASGSSSGAKSSSRRRLPNWHPAATWLPSDASLPPLVKHEKAARPELRLVDNWPAPEKRGAMR
ncbi:MAG TPA: hypothetical protein VFF72_12900 [Caldimonas sp.]|nr:hypothetical protein [Caldimonas sp.]